MGTLRDRLRSEFYLWENLGRGEQVWDCHIDPEPYFVPFFGHGAFVERSGPNDDGRRETLLSSIFGKRPKRDDTKPDPNIERLLAPVRSGVAPDYVRDSRQNLVEALWRLPNDVPWRPGDFEPVLYAFGTADHPVCLEILASGGRIELQWVVDEKDQRSLEDALRQSSFPPSVEWREDHLQALLVTKELPLIWSRDLALQREFVFPLKQEFRTDPLAEIFAGLNHLDERSIAVVQIRFQACVNRWAESIWRLVSWDDGKPFFENGSDFLHAAKQKCRKPLFAVNVSLTVLDDNEDRLEANARRLARSFSGFEEENALVFADAYERSWEERLDDLLHRRSRRSGMLLNGDELLNLVHPPATGVGEPGLERLRRKSWPAPAIVAEARDLALGINEHGSDRIICSLDTPDRLRHMHVLGASGTGKSTFLLHSILQDLENGHGLALLDPHGDLVSAVLDRLPENRIGDVVIFDPADTEWPVGFNILQAHSDIERNLLASDFVAIFERLSSSWGDQMTAVLGNAAMAFLESDRGGTLLDLKRFLVEDGFRKRFLPSVKDPEVRYFWEREFKTLRSGTQASLLTRLNGFLRHRLIRNMVSQRGERFNVARMMNEGKVILAPLSQGLIGEENSWLLGSLLVSRFHQAALSRQSIEETERRQFFLYLDEAHNFITPSISSILSGARKYGLGLVLAHQEIDQFPSRESGILSAILTNCHSRVYFRLGDRDASKLDSAFDHFESDDLRRLRRGEAICRVGGSDCDFNIATASPLETTENFQEIRRRAVEHSRKKYATPREEIEKRDDNPGPPPPPSPPPLPREPPPKPPEPSSSSPSTADVQVPDEPIQNLGDDPKSLSKSATQPSPATATQESQTGDAIDIEVPTKSSSQSTRRPGRGGTRHKMIQEMIKRHAQGLNYFSETESHLADKSGYVDVLLQDRNQPEKTIAFEIAISTDVESECWNLEKSIRNGISTLVVVGEDATHLTRIETAAQEAGLLRPEITVRFLMLENLGDYFAELGCASASHETTSKGYQVSVTYKDGGKDVREARRKNIARTVAETIRSIRKPQEPKDSPDPSA